MNSSTNVYRHFSGVAPDTDHKSCHTFSANGNGSFSSGCFSWELLSFIDASILSSNFIVSLSCGLKTVFISFPFSSFILSPFAGFTQIVFVVSVTIKTFASNFFATSISCLIASSIPLSLESSPGTLFSITAKTFLSFTIKPSTFFLE